MAKFTRLLLACLLTLSIVFVLNTRLGQVPPLGKFLDPFQGAWHNARIPDIPKKRQLRLPGLHDTVEIAFSQRGVPHIFANNHHDLFFAAGYVTAMHRLWQMEFTAFSGLGRISEVVGERALEFDRYLRHIGMAYGAENILDLMMQNEETALVLEAYTMGVNAWISGLRYKDLPLEYKLLDYKPEPWHPLKTCAMVMTMSRGLSLYSQAQRLSFMKAQWGKEVVDALFTPWHKGAEPIVSDDRFWHLFATPPQAPQTPFIPRLVGELFAEERPEATGSNNWAVSPERTHNGKALFATDPHQGLSLPSMWYEMQLNAPGFNVYGVTLPGAPAIIMGFNEYIAWGNTASMNQVADIYEIEMDETGTRYLFEGAWHPLHYRIEKIRVRGAKTLTDTVWYTHHGPIVYRDSEKPFSAQIPTGHALRWIAHEDIFSVKGLLSINQASSYEDFREGLSMVGSPPQNYAYAATSGDIAIHTNGLWPLRWTRQGDFISDGRQAAYDWQGFIPFADMPFELNPQRGFVSSANQVTTNETYPLYYGWDFAGNSRAIIINQKLDSLQEATPLQMKQLQLDETNLEAHLWLQSMTDSVKQYLRIHPEYTTHAYLHQALDSLDNWNQYNTAYSIAPGIFNRWQDKMREVLWEPLTAPLKDFPRIMPKLDISYLVLFHQEPVQAYIQLFGQFPNTGEILTKSLTLALEELTDQHGQPGENWHWWRINGPWLSHLLNIKALSTERMPVGGNNISPNAIRNNYGPSWRMVASMEKPVQAWGIYPGGQTGNPASKGYNAFTKDWAEGRYYPLHLYTHVKEAIYSSESTLRLVPAR